MIEFGNQYCLYCVSCLYYEGKLECDKLDKNLTWKQAQHLNHCPHFILSPMGNAITGKPYKPQRWKYVRSYGRKYNS